MWSGTLRGSDIQLASAKLKGQHSAIQAHLRHLETKIADLEAFEHSIVNFMSNYEVEDPSAAVPDPRSVAEKVAAAIGSEQHRSIRPETATVAASGPAAEKVASEIESEHRLLRLETANVATPGPAAEKANFETESEQDRSMRPETATVAASGPAAEKVASEIESEHRLLRLETANVATPGPAAEKAAFETESEQDRSMRPEAARVAAPEPVAEKAAEEKTKRSWHNPGKNLSAVWTPAERAMHGLAQTR